MRTTRSARIAIFPDVSTPPITRTIIPEEGRIAHDVVVNVGRPRQRGSAELAGLEGSILSHLLSADDRT